MVKLLFILWVVMLSACTTSSEKFVRTDKLTEIPEYEQLRMAYLGKELLSYNNQTYLTQKVLKKEMALAKVTENKANDNVTAAVVFLAPILSSESLFSHRGTNIAGNAMVGMIALDFTFSLIGSNSGKKNTVSRFYMPAQFQGKKVEDEEAAFEFAQKHTFERFDNFAENYHYSWSCYKRCESNNSVYYFSDHNGSDNFYVLTDFLPFEKGTGDSIIHSMLGFEPQWETKSHNGWAISLVNEDAKNPKNLVVYNTQNRRNFLRELTSTGYFYLANVKYGFLSAYGSIYAVDSNYRSDFIKNKVNN